VQKKLTETFLKILYRVPIFSSIG